MDGTAASRSVGRDGQWTHGAPGSGLRRAGDFLGRLPGDLAERAAAAGERYLCGCAEIGGDDFISGRVVTAGTGRRRLSVRRRPTSLRDLTAGRAEGLPRRGHSQGREARGTATLSATGRLTTRADTGQRRPELVCDLTRPSP